MEEEEDFNDEYYDENSIMQAEMKYDSAREEAQLRYMEERLFQKEIWKDIPNYIGVYKISTYGNIKSLKRSTKNQYKNIEKIKSTFITNSGYIAVDLFKKSRAERFLVHRLVAKIFIPNPNNLPQVNHIDGNKQNNNINNLEWCSNSQNMKHAYKNKLEIPNRKVIMQFSKDGEFIKEWESINLASKELKINRSNIIRVCKNDTNRKIAGGFIWKYKEEH